MTIIIKYVFVTVPFLLSPVFNVSQSSTIFIGPVPNLIVIRKASSSQQWKEIQRPTAKH